MYSKTKHIRLQNFDYSSEGAYFLTFNVKYRKCIFGEISDEKIILSETGKIADDYMKSIPEHFINSELDEYSIMPDHIHA